MEEHGNHPNVEKKEEELSFVMHEVHTSLNSIISKLTSLTKREPSNKEDQEPMKEEILETFEYANNIRMLLEYFQVSSNPQEYYSGVKMAPQNLWKKFEKPNEYFKSLIKRKRISYEITKEDSFIPFIEAYPIINAIPNILLDNAVKYAPNDSEILCVFSKEGNDIKIILENEGPYLKEEELENVFEKNTRGKNAEKTGIRGHGFGLNFLHHIVVDMHDGEVGIESTNNYSINGIAYGDFRCTVLLPISD